MHLPVRACVGCRRSRPQHELLRVRRRPDGVAVAGVSRRGRGRSAYLCPSRSCYDQAMRRSGLERSLRRAGRVVVDPQGLWTDLVGAVERELDLLRRTGGTHPPARRIHALEAVREGLLESKGGA